MKIFLMIKPRLCYIMSEVTIKCSGDCGWEVTLEKESVDTVELKEENCDEECDETLAYEEK
jgi:hypothetical protein